MNIVQVMRTGPVIPVIVIVACIGGSWLTPREAVAAGDWSRIAALAREAAALPTDTP